MVRGKNGGSSFPGPIALGLSGPMFFVPVRVPDNVPVTVKNIKIPSFCHVLPLNCLKVYFLIRELFSQ